MKKMRWGLWITVSILLCLSTFIYLRSSTMLLLPKGELLKTVNSPNHTYSFNAYLINAGGATGGFAIRGEIISNSTGNSKDIYWDYSLDKAYVYWIDDNTIFVNGIKLDVNKDKYDYRKHRK